MILLTTPQQPVELILMRQLSASFARPALLVDAAGQLVFANDDARALLGPAVDEDLPIALEEVRRRMNVTAVPLQDATGSLLGTLALLSEAPHR